MAISLARFELIYTFLGKLLGRIQEARRGTLLSSFWRLGFRTHGNELEGLSNFSAREVEECTLTDEFICCYSTSEGSSLFLLRALTTFIPQYKVEKTLGSKAINGVTFCPPRNRDMASQLLETARVLLCWLIETWEVDTQWGLP
jgi:hypothetical protein